MTSALDDLITVIEWLAATKTATGEPAKALERLKNRNHNIPADVRIDMTGGEPFKRDGDI